MWRDNIICFVLLRKKLVGYVSERSYKVVEGFFQRFADNIFEWVLKKKTKYAFG